LHASLARLAPLKFEFETAAAAAEAARKACTVKVAEWQFQVHIDVKE